MSENTEPLTETEIMIVNAYYERLDKLFKNEVRYANANFISKYFIKKRINELIKDVEFYKNLISKLNYESKIIEED